MGGPVGGGLDAPRTIAGGFVLVPIRAIMAAWRGCRRRPLGVGDFRTWLACREMLARRRTADGKRPATYGFAELSRLTGVSEKRSRASVGRLVAAGLLGWSDATIAFPDAESGSGADPGDDTLADTIAGGRGSLAIPRRILRLLVGGARPALIATALAILLRCLARGRGGFRSRGRVKAAWIARAFGVDLRRVKEARKELIDLGWIEPEEADQWSMNRWGATYRIDLGWDRTAVDAGRRSPPLPADPGPRLPPPESDPKPLREANNQEPAPGGPPGVEIEGAGEEPIPPSPPIRAPSASPERKDRAAVARPGAGIEGGAGASPASAGRGRPVPRRPAEVEGGPVGGPLPSPTLDDVRVEDLRDAGRLLRLHDQAVARDLVGSSEADRLKFVAVAEHARAVGTVNPCGLFARLVRRGWWHFATQDDEDAASARLKRHQFGGPREIGDGGRRPGMVEGERRPSDAELVKEVRAAMIRAGVFRDPFPAFRRLNPGWTRERWDGALAELDGPRSGALRGSGSRMAAGPAIEFEA